ncbi:MAG: hypothetical protein BWK80_12740 [Desulfobacteraceae bacterium IS3]|nr:MAG: hypothetical protein BWK80_12740 [Desulfobacteraceae bacterium IS3]HAO22801.1 hypothetical protein [Desulfobacteraceae bacterium]
MKTIVFQLIILMTCCILSISFYAEAKQINMETLDSSVIKHIGTERLTVIFNAEKIASYRVDWTKGSTEKPKTMIGEYPVIEQGTALNKKQSDMIKKLITSPASYGFGWTKRTLLRPSYALRFMHDAEQVDILIDTDSLQWGFSHKGTLSEQNISKDALPVLSKLLEKLFKK